MKRTTVLLGTLLLMLAFVPVTLGAGQATIEGVATKYTLPQEVYIVYGVGVLPTGAALTQEVTQAVCASITYDEQTAQEGAARRPADPLTLPVRAIVSQWTKAGTGFTAERRGEVVVKRCRQKGERDA